jgi:hypothetical protein
MKNIDIQQIDGIQNCESPGCNEPCCLEITATVEGKQVKKFFCQKCTHYNAGQVFNEKVLYHTLLKAVEAEKQIKLLRQKDEDRKKAIDKARRRKKEAAEAEARRKKRIIELKNKAVGSLTFEEVSPKHIPCGFDNCNNYRRFVVPTKCNGTTIKVPICDECKRDKELYEIAEMAKGKSKMLQKT